MSCWVNVIKYLKYTNFIGSIGTLFIAGISLAYADFSGTYRPTYHLFPESNVKFLAKVPCFIYAFSLHYVLFPAFQRMGENGSHKNFKRGVDFQYVFVVIINLVPLLAMYFTFGAGISANFVDELHNQHPHNYDVLAAQILCIVGIFCNQPLLVHASRDCFLTLFKLHTATTAPFNARVRGFRGKFSLRAGVWRMIFAFVLTVAAVVLVFLVHDLSIIISFAGLVGCLPMSFILPPLC